MEKLRVMVSPEHHRRAAEAASMNGPQVPREQYIEIVKRCVFAQALRDLAQNPESVWVSYMHAGFDGNRYKLSEALKRRVKFWTTHRDWWLKVRYYTIHKVER